MLQDLQSRITELVCFMHCLLLGDQRNVSSVVENSDVLSCHIAYDRQSGDSQC